MDEQKPYNRKLRKELKLLKIDNMKMKKQLRSVTRVRFLNRTRLEDEIIKLNQILVKLKSKAFNNVDENTSKIKMEDFSNPQSLYDDKKNNVQKMCSQNYSSEYKFFCDECDFKAKKKTVFEIHMRRHNGIKPYKCVICQKAFVGKYELKLHAGKHSNENKYHCNKCEYSTYRPDMLVNHIHKHSDIKTYQCDSCTFKTDERFKLISHKNTHSLKELSQSCSICKLVKKKMTLTNMDVDDNSKKLLTENMNILIEKRLPQHTCDKTWICNTCYQSFRKKGSLIRHIRTHTGERPYPCDRCDYAAATKHTLIIHKRKHTGDKPYKCSQCAFKCSTKAYLKIHINNHEGIKPYACNLCDYKSVDSSKLNIHGKIHHSNERSFLCDMCPFSSKLRSRLQQHKTIHKKNSYVCPHCGKIFFVKRALQEHEGIHSGNQPFQCRVCKIKKKFTLQASYKRHLARHKLKFCCNLCNYKTALNKDLQRHLKVHLKNSYRPRKYKERAFQCDICKFRCVYKASLIKHVQIKHPYHGYDNITFEERNAKTRTNIKTSLLCKNDPFIVSSNILDNISDEAVVSSVSHQLQLNIQDILSHESLKNYMDCTSFNYVTHQLTSNSPTKDVNTHIGIKHNQPLSGFSNQCEICGFIGVNIQETNNHKKATHKSMGFVFV